MLQVSFSRLNGGVYMSGTNDKHKSASNKLRRILFTALIVVVVSFAALFILFCFGLQLSSVLQFLDRIKSHILYLFSNQWFYLISKHPVLFSLFFVVTLGIAFLFVFGYSIPSFKKDYYKAVLKYNEETQKSVYAHSHRKRTQQELRRDAGVPNNITFVEDDYPYAFTSDAYVSEDKPYGKYTAFVSEDDPSIMHLSQECDNAASLPIHICCDGIGRTPCPNCFDDYSYYELSIRPKWYERYIQLSDKDIEKPESEAEPLTLPAPPDKTPNKWCILEFIVIPFIIAVSLPILFFATPGIEDTLKLFFVIDAESLSNAISDIFLWLCSVGIIASLIIALLSYAVGWALFKVAPIIKNIYDTI